MDAFPAARAAAAKALEIDEWNARGPRGAGPGARLGSGLASELHHPRYALCRAGRHDEAIRASQQALELDPLFA
jgi:hypothetical protein